MIEMRKITKILKEKKIRNRSLFLGCFYLILYLYSTGDIFLGNPLGRGYFYILPNWKEQIFKSKNIFLWEGIGTISLGGFSLAISPLNISLAMALSLLVAANIGIILYSKKHPSSCSLGKPKGMLGVFTSLIGGFACCVPTFIIILGPAFSSLTMFFIRLRMLMIPLSFILLFWGFLWGMKKIN